jgi:beta-lactam-binding protein with PASTA domain
MLLNADNPASKPKRDWVVLWKRRLRQFVQRAVRVFNLTFGTLAMIVVFFFAAFLAMRLAIHGREVNVPNFAGLSDADAQTLAGSLGLNLEVENRFYSLAIPANHVLSQSPQQGDRVRRGWQVRITESLGPQSVAVPDVIGQPERDATVALRRVSLDVASIAYLPSAATPGIVLAQSPPANSTSAQGPGVSLLVSSEPLAATSYALVMPSLIGLSLPAANARLGAVGLRIASAQEPEDQPATPAAATAAEPAADASPTSVRTVITSQLPLPGHRVTRGDNIRVVLSRY